MLRKKQEKMESNFLAIGLKMAIKILFFLEIKY